ncbi:MAG: penicillin-binding transpeptidase domain-containing protein [Oscillospiraceae bacterium]|nr:penicillin-binding transpeptidase domain-containing protein [Oscillospiraceae bacterium]
MQKLYKPARIGLIFVLIAIMLTIYVPALYRMQIYEARPDEDELYPQVIIPRTIPLIAARGNIYDRNGILLASGRPIYSISIDRDLFVRLSDDKRNSIIQDLVFTTMDENVEYIDTFPITPGAPFTYISNMTQDQRTQLNKYFAYFDALSPDMSASDLLAWMRGHYKIDFTIGITEARLIIGIRYEIEMRAIMSNLPPYVFANDVSTDFISLIEERNMLGVHINSTYVREYHTSNAAHLLGYIGPIPEGQVEKFAELGYPLDAVIGRDGAELAFEEQLRGINGSQLIKTSDTGIVMDVSTITEPEPGQNVYLTLDIGIQAVSEEALSTHIESLNLDREEEFDKITGGAVAVVQVQTGELLAAASYPTFNRATMSQDWPMLSIDPNLPMFNRATQGQYNPGSTFKMITGLTGLRYGVIGRYTPIDDVGVYDLYKDKGYAPSCWIYQLNGVGHGELDIVHAIERSCNYFFISVADWIQGGDAAGAEAIAEVALEFGLGRSTGLEVPENPGVLATPDYARDVLKVGWWRADTLMTGFGQGYNEFTPVQLANYAATIANGGTLHSLTLLRRIMSADMSDMIYEHTPDVLNEFAEKDNIKIIQEGMRLVTSSNAGTAYSIFGDYPVSVAAKTGTVELDASERNNGVFICYAPADNPEIAISIVIEKGGSGSAVMAIARMIFDYYFGTEITSFMVPYGELIP